MKINILNVSLGGLYRFSLPPEGCQLIHLEQKILEKTPLRYAQSHVLCTHISWLITADAPVCHLFGSKRECFDSLGKQWLFDVSIRRSSASARG